MWIISINRRVETVWHCSRNRPAQPSSADGRHDELRPDIEGMVQKCRESSSWASRKGMICPLFMDRHIGSPVHENGLIPLCFQWELEVKFTSRYDPNQQHHTDIRHHHGMNGECSPQLQPHSVGSNTHYWFIRCSASLNCHHKRVYESTIHSFKSCFYNADNCTLQWDGESNQGA